MYVCLCVGATSQTICDAVARGACTSKQIAAECGAGADCGRCRRTLRAIIAAESKTAPNCLDSDCVSVDDERSVAQFSYLGR
ncbi:(2Fe-2S)-binding protein [Mycobacterium talmoniae]|uniref:Bacterioferritin-associated ferredoxin n=1 Tax=Mycobacterium talmoniae TaxID=1858794 RepID=A0A1S1NI16_9MYCO|nr:MULTISPECIES: (2Fe-2S)-binding protein [Mycobacterium]OHV05507.1 hypothetical protein BKN37_05430 [Mycobacterium talmoniae]PQM48410.1 hypothetical protein C1Y40_01375 [Mycobacterium talmoniae]TDH57213.1 (2Fe-2S)-binding protein [Mycobacterium eburneum]